MQHRKAEQITVGRAAQVRVEQSRAALRSIVQCSAAQRCAEQCSTVPLRNAVHSDAVQCIAVVRSEQTSAVQCSASHQFFTYRSRRSSRQDELGVGEAQLRHHARPAVSGVSEAVQPNDDVGVRGSLGRERDAEATEPIAGDALQCVAHGR
jgi:hypothetical protein